MPRIVKEICYSVSDHLLSSQARQDIECLRRRGESGNGVINRALDSFLNGREFESVRRVGVDSSISIYERALRAAAIEKTATDAAFHDLYEALLGSRDRELYGRPTWL